MATLRPSVRSPFPAAIGWGALLVVAICVLGAVVFLFLPVGGARCSPWAALVPSLPPAADLSFGPDPPTLKYPVSPSTGATPQEVKNLPEEGRAVALTFDDNYDLESSLTVLRALERAKAPATLFLGGEATMASPSLSLAISRNPLLEIGDHSLEHVDLRALGLDDLRGQIGGGIAAYRDQTGGHTSSFFRAPGGQTDAWVLEVAAEEGFVGTVRWDIAPADWTGISPDAIKEAVLRQIRPGAIILLHMSSPNTADVVPDLILSLRGRGLRLVTLSELLKGDRTLFDVAPDDPAATAILYVHRSGVLPGYATGDFGPGEPLIRADLAAALANILGLQNSRFWVIPQPTFADVPVPDPDRGGDEAAAALARFAAVEEAVAAGLMQGSPGPAGDRLFWPDKAVRRIDLALGLSQAVSVRTGQSAPDQYPAGLLDVPPAAQGPVAEVVARGLMKADDAVFRPWAPVSRGEAAQVLYRLVRYLREATP